MRSTVLASVFETTDDSLGTTDGRESSPPSDDEDDACGRLDRRHSSSFSRKCRISLSYRASAARLASCSRSDPRKKKKRKAQQNTYTSIFTVHAMDYGHEDKRKIQSSLWNQWTPFSKDNLLKIPFTFNKWSRRSL
jgi:hypothetical protein